MHRATEGLRREGAIERVALQVNRSDYMLDEPSDTLLQVWDVQVFMSDPAEFSCASRSRRVHLDCMPPAHSPIAAAC